VLAPDGPVDGGAAPRAGATTAVESRRRRWPRGRRTVCRALLAKLPATLGT
jgi:hypothetical protein